MIRKNSSNAGFTLIELLIVIVIIGILAGIVIGVLNPIQQQARARDGTLKSTLSKLALSTKSLYVSANRSTNKAPTHAEFAAGVGNIQAPVSGAAACTDDVVGTVGSCFFQIQGIGLPDDCAANTYNGAGAIACNIQYYRSGEVFSIAVKGFADPRRSFVYYFNGDGANNSIIEGFYDCPEDYNAAQVGTPPAACNLIQ